MRIYSLLTLLVFTAGCHAHELPDNRVISTNGSGEVLVAPDEAVVKLMAKANHRTSKKAKVDVDNQVNDLLEQLKKLGIKREDIIASSISLNPRYEHKPNVGRYFSGFEAQRHINVTVRKLRQLTTVMDAALGAGVDSIQQISYESSEEQKHLDKARKLAIEDSKSKAALLAQAYDAQLGAIITINYHSNRALSKSATASDTAELSMVRSSARPAVYLPDQLSFRDNIQVTFDLIINQ